MKLNEARGVSSVIIVPRSGYANRLQAVASAAILARDLDADFRLCWEPQEVAPAPAGMILDHDFLKKVAMSPQEFEEQVGMDYRHIPRYLTSHSTCISLAGYEHGEQHFMQGLQLLINGLQQSKDLVISAGGNFSLTSGARAAEERGNWYRELKFAPGIESVARGLIEGHDSYLGLHLRYTDRAHEAPLDREIKSAVSRQVESTGITSIFVASDTRTRKDKWVELLADMNLRPWTAETVSTQRSSELAGVGAMVDWIVLGHARSSVYFAASSFGHEAAVMAGSTDTSIALPGHAIQRIRSRSKELARSLVNYPRNHWFR